MTVFLIMMALAIGYAVGQDPAILKRSTKDDT
jgi:hypothetical protein